MDFGLSKEISADIVQEKVSILNRISSGLEVYFENKEYGKGISSLTIGIICVAPKFEFFFKKIRRKYIKSRKMLEYDIKLDHSVFKDADELQIEKMVAKEVIASLGVINELNIQDFNLKEFKADLRNFFQEKLNIEPDTLS